MAISSATLYKQQSHCPAPELSMSLPFLYSMYYYLTYFKATYLRPIFELDVYSKTEHRLQQDCSLKRSRGLNESTRWVLNGNLFGE